MNTPEFYKLESEIFPRRPSKRIHIQELQAAWAAWCKANEAMQKTGWIKLIMSMKSTLNMLQKMGWWRRAWGWIRRAGR